MYCGLDFVASPRRRANAAGYCGWDCSKSATAARRQARWRVWPPGQRECTGCGVVIADSRNKCDECALITKRARKEREHRRQRALEREAIREPYTLAEIAQRDGFRCGLCRRKVRMDLSGLHPRGPTIDHIVPLSISRDDRRTNVQLAHRRCNVIKRDRDGGQQLALIG